MLGGCGGWEPLYANREAEPANAALRAIKVAPIPERVGQRLEFGLAQFVQPDNVPSPQLYTLNVTAGTSLQNLGIQSQGIGTRGEVQLVATYRLVENKTGAVLQTVTIHANDSFDIQANEYSTVVAQDDADTRCVEDSPPRDRRACHPVSSGPKGYGGVVKLPAARIEAFLRRPDPAIRAVLLFGPDIGLVRERADAVARSVTEDLRDPFRVADLPAATLAADPARLFDEAAQISLMGGRRLVRVRDAGDALSALFGRFLADAPGDALVVAEAGDLPARGSLRRAFDDAPRAVAIGCYPDNARDLAAVIGETLAAHRVSASRDAVEFLVAHLGGDRLLTRGELEKLALYVGDGGRVELDDAWLSIADSAALSFDDAVLAAAEGDAAALDRALARVFQEGESPVAVVRAMLRHLQRLHALAARIVGGDSADSAVRAARPPIFFKQQDSFKRQLRRWSEAALRRQLDALATAEARIKTTGMPGETICREALFALAQARRRHQRARNSANSRSS